MHQGFKRVVGPEAFVPMSDLARRLFSGSSGTFPGLSPMEVACMLVVPYGGGKHPSLTVALFQRWPLQEVLAERPCAPRRLGGEDYFL